MRHSWQVAIAHRHNACAAFVVYIGYKKACLSNWERSKNNSYRFPCGRSPIAPLPYHYQPPISTCARVITLEPGVVIVMFKVWTPPNNGVSFSFELSRFYQRDLFSMVCFFCFVFNIYFPLRSFARVRIVAGELYSVCLPLLLAVCFLTFCPFACCGPLLQCFQILSLPHYKSYDNQKQTKNRNPQL